MTTEGGAAVPAAERPLVYSIILTYNNFDDTDECIASVLAQDYPHHRVIVVDNHSSDGSRELLLDKWAQRVEFVENAANLGVPGGYNAGIEVALAAGAAYVVVFNNDLVVTTDFVSSLAGAFRRRSAHRHRRDGNPLLRRPGPRLVRDDIVRSMVRHYSQRMSRPPAGGAAAGSAPA